MTTFADPDRDRAAASGEFTRVAARLAMLARELERIADRGGVTVPTPSLTNLRDATAMLDGLLRRAPEAELDLDGEHKPKVRLADPLKTVPPKTNPRLRISGRDSGRVDAERMST